MASVSPTLGPFLLNEFSTVSNIDQPRIGVLGQDWLHRRYEQAVIGDREIGNAPAQYRGSMMSSIQPNPLHSRAEIGILPCSKCGKPMWLACIEPAQPGHEVRIFECSECKTTGRFAVAI
jgi:hypothetical protein